MTNTSVVPPSASARTRVLVLVVVTAVERSLVHSS